MITKRSFRLRVMAVVYNKLIKAGQPLWRLRPSHGGSFLILILEPIPFYSKNARFLEWLHCGLTGPTEECKFIAWRERFENSSIPLNNR